MSEEIAAAETTEETTGAADVEKQAFLDRLNKEGGKRKEAEKRAADLEKRINELQAQVEEREAAGLPELDQLRKRLEQAEKRAEENERKAEEAHAQVTTTERKSLVLAAASKAGFDDPSDATRYPEFVNLDDIEDADAAEKAVKRLAKAKPRLLKDEDTKLPGRVLENGRTATATPGKNGAGIQLDAEAQMIADNLQQFLKNRG